MQITRFSSRWIAHDRGHCIDQHAHAAVAVGAEELAGDRRLLARSGIVVDRLRYLIVTDRVDGLLGNSPVRVERCLAQHLRITSRVAVVGQVLGGRLEHQSLWRRVLRIVAFGNESFVERARWMVSTEQEPLGDLGELFVSKEKFDV